MTPVDGVTPTAKVIAVSDKMEFNGMVRVLVHEIAHALGVGYTEYGRWPRRGHRGGRDLHRARRAGVRP